MKIKQLLLPVIALCMTAVSSHAATIVYNFNDTIAFGSNLGAGSPVSANDFSGDGVTVSNWTATSPTRTIGVQGGEVRALKSADNDTHQFTITIPSNVTLNLTSLFFNYGSRGADTSPANFLVTSNVGGGSFTNNPATHTAGDPVNTSVTMAMSGFTGLTNRTVTFTFVDSSQGNNKTESIYSYIDNVTLTGTVIPEPSAALIGGLGVLALFRRRR
jgi:hypothetical protein